MTPRHHYLPLDGVRGLAVLAVMLLHFTVFRPVGALETGLERVLSTGWIGVDLFFVLSGFLITGILVDTRDDPHHFRNFYARRTLRIFPLYYAFLLLLFVVLPALHGDYAAEHAANDRRIWLWTYLGNVLMAQGWDAMPSHTTHLWSLAVEEQFYLGWPLLVYFARGRWLTRLCVGTFVGAILTRALLATQDASAAAYVLTPARMDTLAAGAFVAVLLRQQGADAVRRAVRPMLWSGLALVAIALGWSTTLDGASPFAPLAFGTQTFGYPGIALVFAALVAHVVSAGPARLLPRLLSRPTFRSLGKYSYGLYMIHVPIRNIVRLLLERRGGLPVVGGSQVPAQLVVTLAGIAISFGLAYLSWHLFEKQVLKPKRYFEASDPPTATEPALSLNTPLIPVPAAPSRPAS